MEEKKKRIEMIDALRGFSVVLMVIHHLLYNLVYFFDAPEWLFTNPVFDVLHYIFAGLFILLAGVSSRFSRSNIRRGLIVIAIAAGISAVTYYMRMPIWFGILHLLGFSMLFFGLTRRFWDTIPKRAAPVIYITLIVASALATNCIQLTSSSLKVRNWLSVLGWWQPAKDIDYSLLPWQPGFVFASFDYFSLLPWIFVFLLGTWAGMYIRERKLPGWFYEVKPPIFPAVGRKALLIYVLHQPVLYGLMLGIARLFS